MSNAVARIYGGRPVGKGEYPECCLIGTKNPNTSIDWFCTGVLIHRRIVLTAAHCSIRQINTVALNCEDEDVLVDAEIIPTNRPRNHPNYSTTGGLYDISVLILKEPSNIPPVKIASTEQLNQANKTTLVGFGTNTASADSGLGIKREAEVDITHIRRSSEDNLDVAEINLDFESDLEFVAGGGGVDSCRGDSGGPAYIMVNGNRELAGLTARVAGRPTTLCGEGGVYTRV
ncbi:MAG: trypsin-like serine protease, partial [Bacteroidota bacterium]